MSRLGRRILGKLRIDPSGCMVWTGQLDRDGYGVLRVGRRMMRVARVVFLGAGRPLPKGHVVRHTCDTPACANPAHLVAGTQLANVQDMDRRGRRVNAPARGTKQGLAKLTDEVVRSARAAHRQGQSAAALAREHGVGHATMLDVVRGRTWKHVQ